MLDINMTQKYLIASPGRVGTVFVELYLKKLLESLGQDPKKVQVNHDATLQLDSATTMAVVVHRKNLWASTISSVLADHFYEWVEYTNKPGTFTADIWEFTNYYVWISRWYEAFDYYTKYDHRVDIWFEDFVTNPLVINQSLGLPEIHVPVQTEPSPYKQDRIENLDELRQRFEYLENDHYSHNFPIQERDWTWKL